MDQGFVDTFELFNCYLWRFTLSQVSLAEVDSCFFIVIILFLIGYFFLRLYLYEYTDYEVVLIGDSYDSMISIGVSLLMFWSSYKIYTRLQVINNRWRNI